jgi:hypothetical protein
MENPLATPSARVSAATKVLEVAIKAVELEDVQAQLAMMQARLDAVPSQPRSDEERVERLMALLEMARMRQAAATGDLPRGDFTTGEPEPPPMAREAIVVRLQSDPPLLREVLAALGFAIEAPAGSPRGTSWRKVSSWSDMSV